MIGKLISYFDGWKSIIGYTVLQLPIVSANPMLLEAIKKVLANPKDQAAWIEMVGHLVLVVGLLHKAKKNIFN